ncbi:hypothetical protein D3C85_1022410 [compost metagenome]
MIINQHHRQQQCRTAGVVRDGYRQRQMKQHVADAQGDLRREGDQHQACQSRHADHLQLPGEAEQHQRHQQCADAVGQVNSRARIAVELPAEVVRADVLGQVKAVGEVCRWQPLAVTGWKVDAGHGGVIGTDPATEGDLPDHQQQPSRCPVLQTPWHGQCREHAGQAQGQQKQQAQRGKTAEQMPGHYLRPELERHRPHAECRLREYHRQQEQRQLHRLPRMPAMRPCASGQGHNQQPQRAGEVAVDHLVPALVGLDRSVREMQFGMGQLGFAFRHADEAIAAGPVRAAEAGVGQAGVGAEQHHNQCQQGGKQREAKSRFGHDDALIRCWTVSAGDAGRSADPCPSPQGRSATPDCRAGR